MGYIQQSNTKKIYAYLTQLGKEKIISGDTIDFQVKYFSLHDEDINYIIASNISGTTYNIPKSGFIPNITGDDNICLPNISDATFLKGNMLINNPIVLPPIPPVVISGCTNPNAINYNSLATFDDGSCTFILGCTDPTATNYNPLAIIDDGSCIYQTSQLNATVTEVCSQLQDNVVSVNVTSPNGGTGSGYQWRVIPVDSNNVPIPESSNIYSVFTFGNYLTYKEIGQPFEFLAVNVFDNTIIKYQVYLKDSSSTERLIFTTTLSCQVIPPLQENLVFGSVLPVYYPLGTIGSSQGFPPPFGPIPQIPSLYQLVSFTMRNADNSPISNDSLTNAFFKIEKVDYDSFSSSYNPAWDYIDVVIGDITTPIETTIGNYLAFSFNDNQYGESTSNSNNTVYTKKVPLKFNRLTKGTTRPINSTASTPIQNTGTVKIKLISDYSVSNTFENNELQFAFIIYIWG